MDAHSTATFEVCLTYNCLQEEKKPARVRVSWLISNLLQSRIG